MALETYIFKTNIEEAEKKAYEIVKTRNRALEQAYKDPTSGLVFLTEDKMDYMDELNPDISWLRFNHITGWVSEKLFENPKDNLDINLCIACIEDLKNLRNDCRKVIDHCTMPDGSIKVDKKYCRKIFPSLDLPFSGNQEYDNVFIEEIKKAKQDIDILLLSSWQPDTLFVIYADY